MSDENEKLSGGDADFEGHKLEDQKIEQKLERVSDDAGEPDFEGHQLGGDQRLEKLADKLEG